MSHRTLLLTASFVLMFVATGSLYMVVVALKPIAAELGWPRAVPSAGFALQFVGGGLGGMAMGWWLDRRGAGGPVVASAVMIGLGAMLMSEITAAWQLYAIYAVMMGFFGRSALNSLLMATIAGWDDGQRRSGVGLVFSGQAVGGAVWPLVFQHLNQLHGWRQTALWYGVAVIVTMLPLALLMRRLLPAPAALAAPMPASSRFGGRQAALCAAIVCCCAAMSLPIAHIVAHVSDLGHGDARGAEMLSLMLFSAALSSFFGVGRLAQRIGALRALFIFSFLQTIALALLAATTPLAGLYAVAVLFGLGYGGILPCYPIIVRDILPAGQVGRRTGLVLFFGGIGMAIGSWTGGVIFDWQDTYRPAFLLAAAANMVNLLIVSMLARRTAAPKPQAAE